MTVGPRPSRARRPRRTRSRRRLGPGVIAAAVVAALMFALGVAFGQALEENPEPGDTLTFVRTLEPSTIAPAPRTVTVTVREP